jgi:hypothetical protein
MSSQTASAEHLEDMLPEFEETIGYSHHKSAGDVYNKESFNISTNNSSGLGDSISLPCLSNECSSSSSSVYGGGSNTVNAVYSSCSSSDHSIHDAPKSPNNYLDTFNTSDLQSPSNSQSQSRINPKPISSPTSEHIFGSSNLNHQMNLNQVDYDPFNDYMGIDKYDTVFSKMASMDLGNNKASANNNKTNYNFDQQQQQQIIAQALAAVASSTNANCSSGINGSSGNEGQKQSNRSLTDNIELLNSKFMNHKNLIQQNNGYDKYSDGNKHNTDSNTSSLSSLLATVAAHNAQNQGFQNSDSQHLGYNSANLPMNLKRQSYPLASQNQNSQQMFGGNNNNIGANNNTFCGPSNQSGTNSRLNSTPNLYNSNNIGQLSNEQSNRASNYSSGLSQHSEKPNSMSASNSSFNFNLNSSNDIDSSSTSRNNNQNQTNSSNNNSSCYDDDEVFSSNNSFNTSSNSGNRHTESSNATPVNSLNPNFDTQALAQLYRSFLSGNNNSTNNNNSNNNNPLSSTRNSENNSSQNSTTTNLSELLASYNANLAALSLNPDLINSSTFFKLHKLND